MMGRVAVAGAVLLMVAASVPAIATTPQSFAADGPFLHDASGRAVLLRGVNAVYKLPPYTFTTEAGQPNSLTDADAAAMATLGYDVVRLGIIWKGLEPGLRGRDDPLTCSQGLPQNPGQYNQSTVDAYLSQVDAVVSTLADHGIYTLIDMHQDVYNEYFQGEGAPDWAVCTNHVPPQNLGPWNAHYADPAVGTAFNHFWDNDVTGDLQGEYDRVYAAVASHYAGNPWVLGYDLFNEPFATEVFSVAGAAAFDARLQCFYAGSASPGGQNYTGAPLACSPAVPAGGLIGAIRAADPSHLIFYEPDISSDFGNQDFVGSMPYPGLVLGFHDYCFAGGFLPGAYQNQTPDCAALEPRTMSTKSQERGFATSSSQAGGPGWFLSEFGAEDNPADLSRVADLADQNLLGWTYWAWREWGDPTGSGTEALVNDDGTFRSKVSILARTYPQAVAGTPTAMSFDPASGAFHLSYVPSPSVSAPTVIFVPLAQHYPSGYCAVASGAAITSSPGAPLLTLSNLPGEPAVTIDVSAGAC
jgi:endoglycosylceramidase